MRDERVPSRSAWWDEVLPVLEDHSIETSGLYIPSGIRRDGLVLIRAIDAHPNPLSRDQLTGWAAHSCKDYDDEEYTRSVRDLEGVGLLQFYGSTPMVELTRAAMRFHNILRANHELHQRKRES